MDVLPGAPYRASPACAAGWLAAGHAYAMAVHADLLETVGRNRGVCKRETYTNRVLSRYDGFVVVAKAEPTAAAITKKGSPDT